MERTQQDALYREASSASGPELQRLARGYEADVEHRRDLVQEIHLELWKSLAFFDQRCSLRTWAFRIAHNVGASHVAKRMRAARFVDLEALPADSQADEATAPDRQLSVRQLLDLIHQLGVLDRQVILLYLEGEGAAAIAEITGLSANNVATKIHRIKKLLREQSKEGVSYGEC